MNDIATTLHRPSAFIFDLDGTLVDSFADIATALNLAREDFGLPPVPTAEVKRWVGNGSEMLVRKLVPVAQRRQREAYRRYLEHYERHLVQQTSLYPGAEEVLERYGDRPLAVVTNKVQRFSEPILKHLGILPRFAVVLGGDALPRKKPDPLPLLRALERMGVQPAESVIVGDGVQDIASGRAAGLYTVGVTTGVQNRGALTRDGADTVVDSLFEVMELFD